MKKCKRNFSLEHIFAYRIETDILSANSISKKKRTLLLKVYANNFFFFGGFFRSERSNKIKKKKKFSKYYFEIRNASAFIDDETKENDSAVCNLYLDISNFKKSNNIWRENSRQYFLQQSVW